MKSSRLRSPTLLLFLYCAMIFAVSSIKDPAPPEIGFTYLDKVLHFGAYGVMMLLAYASVGRIAPGLRRPWRVTAALIFCAFYGASDEFHQQFVPGRTAELLDWVADVAGAAIAAPLAVRIEALRSSPRLPSPPDAT